MKINNYAANFGDHRHCVSGDIIVLDYLLNL